MAKANYTVKNVQYIRTHRGVNAYAELWRGKAYVADIEDVAENIVCGLYFKPGVSRDANRAEFYAAAHKEVPPATLAACDNENYIAGEYARWLITQAEEN